MFAKLLVYFLPVAVMWSINNKEIAIAINEEKLGLVRFRDGSQINNLNSIKAFERGIFVNPSLDKRDFISLLRIFHPDASEYDNEISNKISQVINSTKDGSLNVSIPWRVSSNSASRSNKSATNCKSNGNKRNIYEDFVDNADTSSDSENTTSYFDLMLGYVPGYIWELLGGLDTWIRDANVDFRLYKIISYSYFETELELVFINSTGIVYREKITAISDKIALIWNQIDFSRFIRADLQTICDLENINYTGVESKSKLATKVQNFYETAIANLYARPNWYLKVTGKAPIWKHYLIDETFLSNYDLVQPHNWTKKRKPKAKRTPSSTPKYNCYKSGDRTSTSEYLNCGQYLKLIRKRLERNNFMAFLNFVREAARIRGVNPIECQGYPGYPKYLYDEVWAKVDLG